MHIYIYRVYLYIYAWVSYEELYILHFLQYTAIDDTYKIKNPGISAVYLCDIYVCVYIMMIT